jgi:DNA-binding Lrp family transcriptional regulator
MTLDETDRRILAAIEQGLPLVPRPYAALADGLGLEEAEVTARIGALLKAGVIRRFGIVVRHRELGYRANAMVVWDVPDGIASEMGRRISGFPFVTLCYRRPRRPPHWRYNLFCMIHGRDRATVEAQIDALAREAGLDEFPRAVLFSRRRFKQCGGRYAARPGAGRAKEAPAPARLPAAAPALSGGP